MKANKHLATVMAATMVAGSVVPVMAETTNKALIGKNRIETAVKISKDGWNSAETVVLVNDGAIADALTATPLAFAKNAPILLTSKNGLSDQVKAEIKRLGAKNAILIGGNTVLPASIEKELKELGLKPDRIKGDTREETALAIAKRLDAISDVSEIAVVNGTKGLADAVSVAAAAAERHMPILLANPKKGLSASEKFIKDEAIKASYLIGGTTVLPNKMVSSLPGKKRLEGSNRNDTNAKVIETFYKEKELKNVYVAKDGRGGDSQLIDALAVGVLAAKNASPVLIASKNLNAKQVNVINTKEVSNIVQVGGKGNEGAFNQLKEIEKEDVYEVETVEELKEALAKANANDKIVLKPNATITEDIIINTDKNVDIKVEGTVTGKVEITAPNGNVANNSTSKPETNKPSGGGSIVVDGPEVARVTNETELRAALTKTEKTTIKLNNPIEIKGKINIPRSMTLDLNGYTLTQSANDDGIVITTDNVVLNIKNGKISVPDKTAKGKHVAVFVSGISNDKGELIKKTKDVTVNMTGVNIEMGGFEFTDSTNPGSCDYANLFGVYANGTCEDISFDIDRCNISGAAMGVYFPAGSKKIDITSSTIVGGSAVGIKGGTGTIKNSTLVGTGLSSDAYIAGLSPSESGISEAGEALVVEGNYGDRGMDIKVENSKLESKNGYGVRMQFFGGVDKKLSINGGTIKGALGAIFDKHADNKDKNYSENDPGKFVTSFSKTGVTEVTTKTMSTIAKGSDLVKAEDGSLSTSFTWASETGAGSKGAKELGAYNYYDNGVYLRFQIKDDKGLKKFNEVFATASGKAEDHEKKGYAECGMTLKTGEGKINDMEGSNREKADWGALDEAGYKQYHTKLPNDGKNYVFYGVVQGKNVSSTGKTVATKTVGFNPGDSRTISMVLRPKADLSPGIYTITVELVQQGNEGKSLGTIDYNFEIPTK